MSNGVVFKLQPSDPEIPGLIDRYQAELDKDCLAAGERIRKGDCSKENLRIIYRWKMQSYKYLSQEKKYFDSNSDEDVTRILQSTAEAVGADDPERAFNELQSLKGIGLPVASAILTAIVAPKPKGRLTLPSPKQCSVTKRRHLHCRLEGKL